jgi:hypothetical protein
VSENPQKQIEGEENAVADKILKRGNLWWLGVKSLV